jgi:hypothetical protein
MEKSLPSREVFQAIASPTKIKLQVAPTTADWDNR